MARINTPLRAYLETHYKDCFQEVLTLADIPRSVYMVYILTYEDRAIIVGHGKLNRASVLFDGCYGEENRVTPHYKSIYPRLHHLYKNKDPAKYGRFIIPLKSKEEAAKQESKLHSEIGGKGMPYNDFMDDLLEDVDKKSQEYLLLRIAMCSSFSGLCDIRRWRKKNILSEDNWRFLQRKLNLPDWKIDTKE